MILPPNTIIVSGPIIIEDSKVLLNKEMKEYGVSKWFIPGGMVDPNDKSLEETCIREVKEELGCDIEVLRPLRTLLVTRTDNTSKAVLVHFLAKRLNTEIKPGHDIVEWGWHDIHNLPSDCAPNVREVIQSYLAEKLVDFTNKHE